MSKTVIITGASRGVGAATARLFSRMGCNVVVNCSKSVARAEEVATQCRAFGHGVSVIQADVSSDSDCRELVTQTIEKYGSLDYLINNAGTTKYAFDHSNLEALEMEDFLSIYKTNVIGPYNLIKYAKPHLLKSTNPAVVNVASIAAITGIGSSVAYAASKGALVTMTLSLARALGPIRVNAVCPGFIQGEWLQEGLGREGYEKLKEKIETSNPLKRTSTADDVAQVIYFFAAQQQLITGETLIVDGGAHLATTPLSRR